MMKRIVAMFILSVFLLFSGAVSGEENKVHNEHDLVLVQGLLNCHQFQPEFIQECVKQYGEDHVYVLNLNPTYWITPYTHEDTYGKCHYDDGVQDDNYNPAMHIHCNAHDPYRQLAGGQAVKSWEVRHSAPYRVVQQEVCLPGVSEISPCKHTGLHYMEIGSAAQELKDDLSAGRTFSLGEYDLFNYPLYAGVHGTEDQAKFMEEQIYVLQTQYGLGAQFDIIGHSMGGLIARRYAWSHPNSVTGIVTLGTPHWGSPITYSNNLFKTWTAFCPIWIIGQNVNLGQGAGPSLTPQYNAYTNLYFPPTQTPLANNNHVWTIVGSYDTVRVDGPIGWSVAG